MLVVERHIINKSHRFWKEADDLAWRSKNLYNLGKYHVRQNFFAGELIPSFFDLYHSHKTAEAYRALPTKVSKQIVRRLHQKKWQAYFAAVNSYKETPEKFKARPKIPRYKHKTKGRYLVIYPADAASRKELKTGRCKLSKAGCRDATCRVSISVASAAVEVRIILRPTCYVIEVVCERPLTQSVVNPDWIAGIDLGAGNFCTVRSNKIGFKPFLVNGRPLKAIYQLHDKEKPQLQSQLKGDNKTSRRIQHLTHLRNCRADNYLHPASRLIIDQLVAGQIGKMVIGLNPDWKQDATLGKAGNQNFVTIPHARFVSAITYKAQQAGIEVLGIEEFYTSQTSFLYLAPVCQHETYVGKRVKRGLFQSSGGVAINADGGTEYDSESIWEWHF